MTHLRRAMLEELQRRNYAKTTVYYYLKAVERFARFFHTSPDQLNQSHLRQYQAYLLRERKLGPRTVKLHVSALRFFFVKTLKRPYLLDDIPYPKVPRRLPTILTVEEVTRLIAHVVFTLPHALAGLALQNKRVVYDLLFQARVATFLEVARTPKHLGAALGFLSVLHTWGQTLVHHPHVHCVVPAGGLSPDGTRWVHARPSFFLPVKILRRVFRGKVIAGLIEAFRAGTLPLPKDLQRLTDESAFRAWLRPLYRHEWIVYAKPPFGGPRHVLQYLARYTHRVAISNHRPVDVRDDQVTFRWKDYRQGSQIRLMTLSAEDFLRRFCLHVLPKGFVRIRFYGFLAPRCRTEALSRCRHALDASPPPAPAASAGDTPTPVSLPPCPHCGGAMVAVERLTARQIAVQAFIEGLALDSS